MPAATSSVVPPWAPARGGKESKQAAVSEADGVADGEGEEVKAAGAGVYECYVRNKSGGVRVKGFKFPCDPRRYNQCLVGAPQFETHPTTVGIFSR